MKHLNRDLHRRRAHARLSSRLHRLRHLSFDQLEERRMLTTTITVNSTTDLADGDSSSIANLIASPGMDGAISLREAIKAANNTPGHDIIAFAIPGSGVHTIHVGQLTPTETMPSGRGFPTINDPVTIDGYTQGDSTPDDSSDDALENTNDTGQGINATLKIELDGSTATENNTHGLDLRTGGAGSIIRGLVINSFNGVGIKILGADNVQIAGNFIGTDASGSFGIANSSGIHIETGSANQIGGPSPSLRNLVSGNSIVGVVAGGTDNKIAGNLIGTDQTGMYSVPNRIGVNSGGVRTQIGGATPEWRNVISGNTPPDFDSSNPSTWGYGVLHSSAFVWGNYIGTNVYGNAALPNHNGVRGGSVGGALPGQGNVISGNSMTGVAGADRIEGNLIGTDATGLIPIPNGTGVFMQGGTGTIGGIAPGAANVIANNHDFNVRIDAGHYAILGNSIFGYPTIGNLDLVGPGYGRDINDPLDADTGANDHQNYPELSSVQSNGSSTVITGALYSLAEKDFRLEFFSNPDDSLQGETFIGATTVTTDASGDATFTVSLSAAVAAGRFVTSTATDLLGNNTSEFSDAIESVAAPQLVTVDIDPDSLNVDSNGTLTVLIYGATDFLASQIDVSTVLFAGAHAWESSLLDANQDGLLDLQLKFRTQDTALRDLYEQLLIDDFDADGILDSTRQSAEVSVTGQTLDDALFSGSDNLTLFLAGRSLPTSSTTSSAKPM
jgi:hypothetical protein